MQPLLAYVDDGRLYLVDEHGTTHKVESRFVHQAAQTARQIEQAREWRQSSMMKSLGMAGPGQTPAADDDDAEQALHVEFTGVTHGWQPGEITYLLRTDVVGGLFAYDPTTGEERRLFHKERFFAADLVRDPATGVLATTMPGSDGTSGIVVLDEHGTDRREVTEGDSIDMAPSWVPGPDLQLVFQSAGIARNREGFVAAIGPCSIERLDVRTRSITTLLQSPDHDYLVPRMAPDGTLHAIRRPWKAAAAPTIAPARLLLDIVLFPYRMARAMLFFLDAFSRVFTAKPLITAVGPRKSTKDEARQMWVRGRVVEIGHKARRGPEGEDAGHVGDDWELIRLAPGAAEPQVIARAVMDYDLAPDGTVVYTNGVAVYTLPPGGQRRRLARGARVERVVSLHTHRSPSAP